MDGRDGARTTMEDFDNKKRLDADNEIVIVEHGESKCSDQE